MSSIRNLLNQFRMSKGYNSDILGKEMAEFVNWIDRQKQIGEKYKLLLKEMGLSFDDISCAEVGKSKYDTVVTNLKTTVITPETDINTNGYIINSGFTVYNGNPTVISQTSTKKITFGQINTNIINTFMTQNPYSETMIENWNELPNNKNVDVIVGIYGSIADKDIKIKKEKLIKFREKLDKYVYEEAIYNNAYCCVVASEQKTLKKVI